jgi:hypothetical protein
MSILTNKRMGFLKNYIEGELRGYDWFRGVKVSMSEWKYKDLVLPCYDIDIDSGGQSLYTEFIEDLDTMFSVLCPKDKDGKTIAVWDLISE